VLHGIVREHLAAFLRRADEQYATSLPKDVRRAFDRYLRCGLTRWIDRRSLAPARGDGDDEADADALDACARAAVQPLRPPSGRPRRTACKLYLVTPALESADDAWTTYPLAKVDAKTYPKDVLERI